jgi:hypothetical protein
VHLGDPEPFGDLGLGNVREESKHEHGSLTFGQRRHQQANRFDIEHLSRLASKSPKLLLTDCPSSSPAARGRGRQTTGWSRRGGDLGLHYLFPVDPQMPAISLAWAHVPTVETTPRRPY